MSWSNDSCAGLSEMGANSGRHLFENGGVYWAIKIWGRSISNDDVSGAILKMKHECGEMYDCEGEGVRSVRTDCKSIVLQTGALLLFNAEWQEVKILATRVKDGLNGKKSMELIREEMK